MSLTEKIFRYCERGADPAFWGEPLNALSNFAFFIGAAVAFAIWRRARPDDCTGLAEPALIGLVVVIGVGSFLFHTFATRWAAIVDVAPIGVFMLAYLGYALRRLLGLGWLPTAVGLALFVAALQMAGDIQCQRTGLLGIAEASRGPCLNGTLGYLPALLAMAGIGAALQLRHHVAAPYLLAAAGVFLVSMMFRTIDLETCAFTSLGGRVRGTHALWHLCNALTLTLLLIGAVRAPRRDAP
jgi:hypothetical protein